MQRFMEIRPCVELRLCILLMPALVLIFSACNSSSPSRPVSSQLLLPAATSPDHPRLTPTEVIATLKTYLSSKPAEPTNKRARRVRKESVSIGDCLHVIGNGRFASQYLGDGVWAAVFIPAGAADDPRVDVFRQLWEANPDPADRDVMQRNDPVAALNVLIEVGSLLGVSMTKYVPDPIIDKITAPSVEMGSLKRVAYRRSTWLVFEDVPAVDVPRGYENPNAC